MQRGKGPKAGFEKRSSPAKESLIRWISVFLRRARKALRSPSPDNIHDVRTAIRRCRSLTASALEIVQAPELEKIEKKTKPLFKKLGALRDTHVKIQWIHRLFPFQTPFRKRILEILRQTEKEQTEIALQALQKTKTGKYQNLQEIVSGRDTDWTTDESLLKSMALNHWEEAHSVHIRAAKCRRDKDYHRLRIQIKKFRYFIENTLPDLSKRWGKDLKRIQDILGEYHDLSELRDWILKATPASSKKELQPWLKKIQKEQELRLELYRQKMTGSRTLWKEWQKTLSTASPEN